VPILADDIAATAGEVIMIQFEWPWLLLLLPLPLLLRWLLPASPRMDEAAIRVPFFDDFTPLAEAKGLGQSSRWPLVIAGMAWLLLISASARPQWLGDPVELPISGRDLMLAVDLSGSMEAEDFQINGRTVNRLMATQWVAGEFINRRVGDRIGLILFGRQAYIQTPLTFDRETVRTLLNEAVIGLAGQETAIGDAIGLAVKRMRIDDNKNDVAPDAGKASASQVLILLTDGANTAGKVDPVKAAELAAQHQLKIYTIGIGADEMLVRSLFGTRRINPSADLDEKSLKTIAETTGGRYFRARDLDELENIYQLLDEMEPIEKESQIFRPQQSLYYYPLAVACLLAVIVLMLTATGRREK
jgi:Ca-activated chloride channel family protein